MIIHIDNKDVEVKNCIKFKDRLMGLMFKSDITPYYFPHCNSIHTFFMKKNIDVIMTDKKNKVVAIYKNVSKNKIITNKKAYNTLELPTNTYKVKLDETII